MGCRGRKVQGLLLLIVEGEERGEKEGGEGGRGEWGKGGTKLGGRGRRGETDLGKVGGEVGGYGKGRWDRKKCRWERENMYDKQPEKTKTTFGRSKRYVLLSMGRSMGKKAG